MDGRTLAQGGNLVTALFDLCAQRVRALVDQAELEQRGIASDALVKRITEIVDRNLKSGRADRVTLAGPQTEDSKSSGAPADPEPGTPAESETDQPAATDDPRTAYVDHVIETYLRESERVESLAAKDEAAWSEFYEQKATHAYRILRRGQMPAARAATEAEDFAQQACETIFSETFPYDVPFDAWAGRILINLILHRDTRSNELLDREPGISSLDQFSRRDPDSDFSLYQLLTDESSEAIFERLEIQEQLLQAIAGLPSEAQQHVIIDTFFYELTDDEIQQRLGKSRQAVYNLRHRALRNLRQILESVKD